MATATQARQPEKGPAFEDVWAMFQSSKAEHDRMIAETEKQFQASKAEHDRMIAYETDKNVSVAQGRVFLNDSLISAYTFRQNYYFMAGDLVADSKDSRYWGLLPEDHIVGKVAFIWQSKDKNTGMRKWKRFFKTIN